MYLLDTSVLVGDEQGRLVVRLPDEGEAALSVVTLAELHLGVLVATTDDARRLRLATLLWAQMFDALPVTAEVAERFAGLVTAARAAGKRLKALDALIAATAATHDLVLLTRDTDFEGLPVQVEILRSA